MFWFRKDMKRISDTKNPQGIAMKYIFFEK